MTDYNVKPQDEAEWTRLIGEYYGNPDAAYAQLQLNHPDRYGAFGSSGAAQPGGASGATGSRSIMDVISEISTGQVKQVQATAETSNTAASDLPANNTWFGIDKRYVSMAFLGSAIVAILLFIAALSELSLKSAFEDLHAN